MLKSSLTFTETSIIKTRKQSSSMLSVRPQGGSQAFERYRTSDVMVSDEGSSTNASTKTSMMVILKILREEENTTAVVKCKVTENVKHMKIIKTKRFFSCICINM